MKSFQKIPLAFAPKKILPSKTTVPPKPNGFKRRHAQLNDSDDDNSDDNQHQDISHYDQAAGGAVTIKAPPSSRKKLVIPVEPNHDRLKYKRRGQKSVLPTGDKESDEVDMPSQPTQFGLVAAGTGQVGRNVNADNSTDITSSALPKSEDELALEALHGKTVSSRVIPLTEDEALDRDVNDAQERPSVHDYSAVPVSEFGAALLRGMGWKDTETISSDVSKSSIKLRVLERRPALLGVGAKPSKSTGIEIGEWGKADHSKKKEIYTPVILKNKKTGEVMTEADLKSQTGKADPDDSEMVFERSKEKSDRRPDDRAREKSEPRDHQGNAYDRKDGRDRDHSRQDRLDRGYSRKQEDIREERRYHDRDDRDKHRIRKDERRERDKYDKDRRHDERDRYRDGDKERKGYKKDSEHQSNRDRRDDSRNDDRKRDRYSSSRRYSD
jgi:hypothetical protein